MNIVLGPFELERPIARGGMGEIWLGRHVEQNTPVAVKVLSATHVRNDASRKLFRDEIKAMAGLHHPGVIMVFDHGIIPGRTAKQTDGRLVEGAAFVAMEFASLGSLKDQRAVLPWVHVRSILLSLLDALAHAHARGVIHRDIKPGNILLSGSDDVRPGLKLADFGLAHTVERFDEIDQVTGTPRYMAPEQFTAQWRDFGPWTDLYALGLVAWELASGAPAYRGGMSRVAAMHMAGELPPFRAQIPVPIGFEAWLHRMLNREPRLRFQRAADAAFNLALLPEPTGVFSPTESTHSIISNPTLTLDDTLLLATGSTGAQGEWRKSTTDELPQQLWDASPPMPPTWKRPDPPQAPLQLLGVGLGLFGVRSIPLVDRTEERDCIWDALSDAHTLEETRAVVLQGAAGNGKSRLVQWISERAHEVGAATVFKAVHGPIPGPMDGLAPMVSRFYRCVGLERKEVLSRLDRQLAWEGAQLADEPLALTELIAPAADGVDGQIRLNSPTERYVLIRRSIQRRARYRPVIVWLDDVQWGEDALAFTRYMLDEAPVGAVTFLLTVQEEALAERDAERLQLDALLRKDGTVRQRVGPLAPNDRRELVRVLLGLDGSLADQLAERTGGNPLFTVQLVGDWVERGMLIPGRQGFQLRSGATVDLPDNLHEVWSGRLERLLADQPDGARRCLIIASALGQEIREEEWRNVCGRSGAEIPPKLVEILMENRLAEPTDGGWSFSHGMLRESLQRIATDDGQWASINMACASALSAVRPRPFGRLGRHLFAAGDYAGAATQLRKAALLALEKEDSRSARAFLSLNEDALRRAAPPIADASWGELWLLRARIHSQLSELDETVREATRAHLSARRHGWEALIPQALTQLANVEKARGNLIEAERHYTGALPLYDELGDRKRVANCLISISHTRILGGDAVGATEPLERAKSIYSALGDFNGMARCLRFFGDIARLANRWERARELFVESNALHRRAGDRSNASSALHGVAEMDRLLGNLDAAERGYRGVLVLDEARGNYAAIPRLNLALCQLSRGNFSDARTSLEPLIEVWTRQKKRGFIAIGQLALATAFAGIGDWGGFDRELAEAVVLIAQTGMVDIDVGQCAERAAELALKVERPERARIALQLALRNWEQLGDGDRVASVTAKLAALPRPR